MEGQPHMIPMPGPGNTPPESFERKLTADEERAALLGFMGNMYGEAKKMDSNIVGPTNALQRGKSDDIKKQIERVYTQHRQPVQHVQATPPPSPVVQAQPPVEPVQELPVQPQIDDNQLTFSFNVNEKDELFTLIEKVLTRVDKLHRKVDEMTIAYKEFTETYNEVCAKKKSIDKKNS